MSIEYKGYSIKFNGDSKVYSLRSNLRTIETSSLFEMLNAIDHF